MKTISSSTSPRKQSASYADVNPNIMKSPENPIVRLEISSETLHRLFKDGQICAADVRCLDGVSKQCIWKLCLQISKDF